MLYAITFVCFIATIGCQGHRRVAEIPIFAEIKDLNDLTQAVHSKFTAAHKRLELADDFFFRDRLNSKQWWKEIPENIGAKKISRTKPKTMKQNKNHKIKKSYSNRKFPLVDRHLDLSDTQKTARSTHLDSKAKKYNAVLKRKEIKRRSFLSEETYKPVDFSKSTFVGVPLAMLLEMLQTKTSSSSVLSLLQRSNDMTSGVVSFIKETVPNIGNIVYRG